MGSSGPPRENQHALRAGTELVLWAIAGAIAPMKIAIVPSLLFLLPFE